MTAKQGTISHIFASASATAVAGGGTKVPKAVKKASSTPAVEAPPSTASALTHPDPRVRAFYAQLSPAEVIAHTIAVEKLGTSYDVTRTHGFVKWCKANP
jgi:hypothetical protein